MIILYFKNKKTIKVPPLGTHNERKIKTRGRILSEDNKKDGKKKRHRFTKIAISPLNKQNSISRNRSTIQPSNESKNYCFSLSIK